MSKKSSFTRRAALRASALGGLLGALSRTTFAAAPPWMQSSNDKLLTIFLRGGYDSVNSFIPDGDPDYNLANRKSLYIKTADSLAIPGSTFTRLNPALAPLQPLITAQRAVFAHNVGNPARTGSHFEDQRTWETGITGCTPVSADPEEGWAARASSALFGSGFNGASVSNGMQQMFRTRIHQGAFDPDRVLAHIKSIRNFPGDTNPLYTIDSTIGALDDKLVGSTTAAPPFGLKAIYAGGSQPTHIKDRFARAVGQAMLSSTERVGMIPGGYAPVNGAKYPFGKPSADYPLPSAVPALLAGDNNFNVRRFFMYLRDAVMLLRSIPEVRMVGIEIGGWDTHSKQGSVDAMGNPEGQLAELLNAVSYGVSQVDLESQMTGSGIEDLTTLVFSEFGRTSTTNSTDGTDHGGSTTVWQIGNRARRAAAGNPIYNDGTSWAGMYSANDQDFGCSPTGGGTKYFVGMRTDFRAIFAEVLRDLFSASNGQIDAAIPGYSTSGLAATELDWIQ